MSKEGCCSINFNDFTLDRGATNPNWLTPSKNQRIQSITNGALESSYDKRRALREKKKNKKAEGISKARKKAYEKKSKKFFSSKFARYKKKK